MFIPVSESILNVPDEEIAVVLSPFIVIAPLASTSNVLASISIGLSLSVPIEIDVSESNVNAPAAFTSNTPLPLIVIAPLHLYLKLMNLHQLVHQLLHRYQYL